MTKEAAILLLLNVFHIDDFIYEVRDHAREGGYNDTFPAGKDFNGTSWDHPAVLAYSEAIEALRND